MPLPASLNACLTIFLSEILLPKWLCTTCSVFSFSVPGEGLPLGDLHLALHLGGVGERVLAFLSLSAEDVARSPPLLVEELCLSLSGDSCCPLLLMGLLFLSILLLSISISFFLALFSGSPLLGLSLLLGDGDLLLSFLGDGDLLLSEHRGFSGL